MALGANIRILIIRFFALFYSSKKSKVIFYHDIHSSKKYTDMSTPIDLFVQHINIIKENGFEIVSEITKAHGQIEICFDDGFLGLYHNIELIKRLNIPIHLFVISGFIFVLSNLNTPAIPHINLTLMLNLFKLIT